MTERAELGFPTTQLPKGVIMGGGESCIVQLPELPRTPRRPSAPLGTADRLARGVRCEVSRNLECLLWEGVPGCRAPGYLGIQAAGRVGGLVDGQVC